jgi:carbamoyltransferase
MSKLELTGINSARVGYEYDHLSQRTKRVPLLLREHYDLAASVQKYLEAEILELAQRARKLTGSDNLCMAGGVAMNCVANSVLENSGTFQGVHLQPACEDNGIAMGSALAELGQYAQLRTPYLGPSFTDKDIATILASQGIKSELSDDVSSDTASIVASGGVVGWFQGGLEYGPRALGNRSILANPSIPGMHTKVSNAKRRELWRPFGPSVLEEFGEDLFDRFVSSPYMLRSFNVRPEWTNRLAAVTHVDGSTRPQSVTEVANPRYYRLIKKFAELTGIPAVLNTSFNDDREPIVCTPDDAIKTFVTTGLDVLVLGNRIIRKNG